MNKKSGMKGNTKPHNSKKEWAMAFFCSDTNKTMFTRGLLQPIAQPIVMREMTILVQLNNSQIYTTEHSPDLDFNFSGVDVVKCREIDAFFELDENDNETCLVSYASTPISMPLSFTDINQQQIKKISVFSVDSIGIHTLSMFDVANDTLPLFNIEDMPSQYFMLLPDEDESNGIRNYLIDSMASFMEVKRTSGSIAMSTPYNDNMIAKAFKKMLFYSLTLDTGSILTTPKEIQQILESHRRF